MLMSWRRVRIPTGRIARESILLGSLVAAFVGLLVVVAHSAPTGFDRTMARYVQALGWSDFGWDAQFGSDLGGGLYGFYLAPAVVAAGFAVTRQWKLLALVIGAFALHYALISPKLLVDASRPSPEFGVEGGGGPFSFPSGHVQWAVSFYGLLGYLAWQRAERQLVRAGVVATYAGIVVLTMIARIDLGRHWPIDTIAGILIGLIALRLLIVLHGWSGFSIRGRDGRWAPDH